jgi:cyanophycinase-like exopeptidase
MSGPVALLGSGEFLPTMEQLDRHLLDGQPQRVVHLPTAAGQETGRRLRYWRDLARRHFEDRLGVEVETLGVLDTNSANDPRNVAMLEGAGLIYLSGGNPGYLAEALRGTEVLKVIRDMVSDGTALAGCSAGAAALTAVAPDVRSGEGSGLGLGLVPGLAIIPHYDAMRRWRRGMTQRFTDAAPAGVIVVGIDEDTAILTTDLRSYEVFGIGTAVHLADGSIYGPGDRFEI